MAKQTRGFCKYCGKEYTKGGMLRHLTACKKRKEVLEKENSQKRCGYFQIVISGKYSNAYWLIIEISENATLKDLDGFIRDIWVECCGHLSAFMINGIEYEDSEFMGDIWDSSVESTECKLKSVVSVGDIIAYEYDFGSTTELVLKVHSYRMGARKKEKITILSRNNPLEIICSQCGKNRADWINTYDYYGEKPFWCEECLKKSAIEEECGDDCDDYYDDCENCDEIYEYMLPVCNSPRMGVCGYEGSRIYPDQFEPDEK